MAGALCALTVAGASASDFFSTERCDRFISFGARVGVNTSNRTMSGKPFPGFYHHESWGTGFDLGVVANINFRDFISLQPGVFFESRSGRYSLMGPLDNIGGLPATEAAQAGKRNSYNLVVPVMVVVGFNVTDDIRWSLEAGPYVSFLLDSKMKCSYYMDTDEINDRGMIFSRKPAKVDFGCKLGTGLRLFRHYYIGAHYMAGCVDAWRNGSLPGEKKQNYGGVTKAWTFTFGYDF